ncbi:MAG: cation:proton antiporter [Nostocoides sp.]
MLFIVIPSQLSVDQLRLIDTRVVLFVLALLLVVRPLTILAATWHTPMDSPNRALLAWIAPRGIVAAATAGVFGPALVDAGYADAERLLPTVFLVILVTVLVHGFTLGPLARRLGLAAGAANGLLIVGSTPWSRSLATTLTRVEVPVLIADGSWQALKHARTSGIPPYYGEVLSEHAEEDMEVGHLSHVLAATDNDYYNALVCRTLRRAFGFPRTFQLPAQPGAADEGKGLSLQRRGYFAFNGATDYYTLQERLDAGWTVRATKLTDDYPYAQLRERLGQLDPDWMLLAIVSLRGALKLYSATFEFTPEVGATVAHFSPAVPNDRSGDDQALDEESRQASRAASAPSE